MSEPLTQRLAVDGPDLSRVVWFSGPSPEKSFERDQGRSPSQPHVAVASAPRRDARPVPAAETSESESSRPPFACSRRRASTPHASAKWPTPRASLLDGTIYLYFKSKDELLVSLFEDRVERLLVFLQTELPALSTARAKLRRIIELQLGLLDGERDLAEVVTVILRQSSKLMKEYAAPKFTAYLDVIAGVVAQGQASGELRQEVSPHVAARAIFGALDGLAMTWALGKADRGGLVRAAGQLADLVLGGLARA